MAVNAAAVVPPAVGLCGVGFDDENVVAGQQQLRGDDVGLGCVARGVLAQRLPVQPYGAERLDGIIENDMNAIVQEQAPEHRRT